ncbi:MAG: glutamate synthase, partial [Spirochaetaceae bacterium]|nr:glutamate synthase [Spirochaetaceae bacterium]
MKEIDAVKMHFTALNEQVRSLADSEITINGCLGQRYIASGLGGKSITINGIPGNALGAYMDGSVITVNGNVQDATGDTMNAGVIIVHGNAGDATGYGMRGGAIYVRGDTGY